MLKGESVDTEIIDLARGHAEILFGKIAGLLTRNGLEYAGLTHIAVTTGPGSFTGLRIGLSAARGLGLTRAETTFTVSLPQAWRGMIAALLLALGRALGEGIAVFFVIGRQDNQWPANLLSLRPLTEAGQTLTSKLVGAEINLAYGDPLHWAAMVGLGLMLMMLVGGITWLGARWMRRKEHHAQGA